MISVFLALAAAGVVDADGLGAADIVVTGVSPSGYTGSKTGTDLRDVPAAIVVVPERILDDQDVRTLDAALENASAVTPSFAGSYGLADNYLIRGLPMRFLRDGLPDGPSFMGYRRTLADIAAVEVLKGPGSALYGRAEAGGSVNLVTRAPAGEAALEAKASYARFDSVTLTADVTAPIADRLSGRLIGNYEETDGYRGLGRRFVDALPTLSAKLGGHALVLDYDRRDQRAVVDNYGLPFTTARALAAVDRDARFYSPFNEVEQEIDRVAITDAFEAAPFLSLRAALIYDRRDIRVARNAGGNAVNAAGVMTGRNGRTQADDTEFWTGQAEAVLRFDAAWAAHTLLLGFEYADSDLRTVRRNYALPDVRIAGGTARAPEIGIPAVTTPGFDRRIAATTVSVYGQHQVDIADVVKLRAGARYDGLKLVDDGTVGTARRRIAGSPGLFSWQAGAMVQPAAWVSLYGGYARGEFVSIQTESVSLTPVPEGSSQIEAGLKAEPIPGRLSVNLALFETRRDRFFVSLAPGEDPVPVGKQRARGVELDMIGEPVEGVSLIANLAYVDARNRSAALASVTGIALNQPVFGKRIGSTPRWSGAIWANWEPAALAGFSAGAGMVYKGAVFVDSLELLRVPDYAVARAAIGYRFGPVEARLTVNNLFDSDFFSVPTFVGALPGEPRSVQITLRAAL